MSRYGLTSVVGALIALGWVARPVAASVPTRAVPPLALQLEVGETRIMPMPGITRVAVGNGQILNAAVIDDKEVAVFARQEGASSLHLWRASGVGAAYTVQVLPAGLTRMQHEVQALLQRIPNARSATVGGNIVIEGNDLADDDRMRIAALAQRYPGVLDFTSQVGWDRMVLLDVQVVELPRARLREFGVSWDGITQGGVNAGLAWDAGSTGALAERPGSGVLKTAMPTAGMAGYFGVNALISARIAALAQSGEAVMLAQPQLLARSGTTASFLAGGEVPYTSTDGNGNSTTQFKPYGVSLNITPRIDRNGAIRSRIEVEASSVDASLSVAGGPALRTRRAATEFNVRSGQTLVLGGFLSRERSQERTGLPVLQHIPLLGVLFSSRRDQRKDTELAIFVTPRIVSQDHPGLAHRVRLGHQMLNQAFPDPPPLGTAIPGPDVAGWSSPLGTGSQWQPAQRPLPASSQEP